MSNAKVNGLPCDFCGSTVKHLPNCLIGSKLRPRVVCLCGSTRFRDAYEKAQRDETLAGRIVLSVGMFGHQEGIDTDGPVKAMLDELHLRKIDLADEVMVLNVLYPTCPECGLIREANSHVMCKGAAFVLRPYVGESTRREIAYALSQGKLVRYLNPPEQTS